MPRSEAGDSHSGQGSLACHATDPSESNGAIAALPAMSGPSMVVPNAPPAGAAVAEASPPLHEAGWLMDADIARELAQLTALQNRQRPGGDSPVSVNPTPLTLLSLFSHA